MTHTGLPGDNSKDAETDDTDPRDSGNLLEKAGDAVRSVTHSDPHESDSDQ